MTPYPAPPPAPSSSGTAVAVIAVVAAIVVLLLLAAAAAVFFTARAVTSRALAADGGPSGGGGLGFGATGPSLTWDAAGPLSVVPADVNGDGVEDFVGRYRVNESAGLVVYAGAFDGKTFGRIWSAGPFGTAEQAVTSTQIAVAGDAVVVTDFRAQLHVLDLRTGKEKAKLALTDRAQAACSPADGARHVWVKTADGQNVVADLDASTLTPTPARPSWCGPKDTVFCEGIGPSGSCAASMTAMTRFQSAGLVAFQEMIAGGDGVAVGLKTPGTPSTLAVGFDPQTFEVRWHASVAPDPLLESAGSVGMMQTTLAGGRLYSGYSTASSGGMHLAVLDAKSGARVLDVPLAHKNEPEGMGSIVPTATRIYVPNWMWLDVIDATTGKLLGSVGTWP